MKLRRRHLFLDLEDTIITPVVNGWADFELINVDKIRSVIEEFAPNSVNLFSFAVWDQHQLALFEQHTLPHIERVLELKISHKPTVDDHIIPACCRQTGTHPSTVEFHDASAFWGKHQSFRLFVRDFFKNKQGDHHVLLLDDAVWDEDWEWHDVRVKGTIRNILGECVL